MVREVRAARAPAPRRRGGLAAGPPACRACASRLPPTFATALWHRRYVGWDSEVVAAHGGRCRCDLYLLTGDEIPFVQDGLRDGEHLRHAMHGWFERALREQTVPWQLLRGAPAARLERALGLVRGPFAGSRWQPPGCPAAPPPPVG